jgi:hypothetical protein
VNAINPLRNWYDSDVIGIDTGVTMVMAENARTGFVWDTFHEESGSAAPHGTGWIQDLRALTEAADPLRAVYAITPAR